MVDNKAYLTLKTEVRFGNNLFQDCEMDKQNLKKKSPSRGWR